MYFLNRVEGFVFYIFRAGWHIDLGSQKEQMKMMLILQAEPSRDRILGSCTRDISVGYHTEKLRTSTLEFPASLLTHR